MSLTAFASAEVMDLDPLSVDPDRESRIGLFYPAKAEALADLIAAHGQNDPIKVRRNGPRAAFEWTLVAGLHRLQACSIAKLPVAAIEVKGDEIDLARIQASENIDRRELSPLERAMFVHAIAEVAKMRAFEEHGVNNSKALAAKAKAAKVQFFDLQVADSMAEAAEASLASAYGWSAETAAACGLSASDLKRSLRIHRCLIADNRDLLDRFKDHPVAQIATMLLKICPLHERTRRRIIEWLIEHPQATSVEEAFAECLLNFKGKGVQGAPDEQRFNKAMSLFGSAKFPRAEQLALFQSPKFQDLLPKEVRDLLKPIRRDGSLPGDGK